MVRFPWDLNSLDFLDEFNLDYHKIASAMIVDLKFIHEVAKKKKTYFYFYWHVL